MMYEHVGEDSGFWILDSGCGTSSYAMLYAMHTSCYDSLKKQQLESTSPKKK